MIKNNLKLNDWLKDAAKHINMNECVYLVRSMCETTTIDMEQILPSCAQVCLNLALEKRIAQVPLAKILQQKYFMNHCFVTNENTLDPRPETEALLEAISIKPRTILELGVGSGCLILSAMKMFPKAHTVGIDISKSALSVALLNAEILQLKRITFIENNWANNLPSLLNKNHNFRVDDSKKNNVDTLHFDLILSNPPYVDSKMTLDAQTLHDPTLALFGNAQTYINLFESLENVSFLEMILEVPEYLVNEIENYLKITKKIRFNSYAFSQIHNSGIFTLKITNTII